MTILLRTDPGCPTPARFSASSRMTNGFAPAHFDQRCAPSTPPRELGIGVSGPPAEGPPYKRGHERINQGTIDSCGLCRSRTHAGSRTSPQRAAQLLGTGEVAACCLTLRCHLVEPATWSDFPRRRPPGLRCLLSRRCSPSSRSTAQEKVRPAQLSAGTASTPAHLLRDGIAVKFELTTL